MRREYQFSLDNDRFFYQWIVGTSKNTFSTILELERTLFHDIHNFYYSEIDNLPISELYYLMITRPKEQSSENEEEMMSKFNDDFEKRIGLVGNAKYKH